MPENKDSSIHGYQEKYALELYRHFPNEFQRPASKREGLPQTAKPYQISEDNRKLLRKYHAHLEALGEPGTARRWTIFRLLGRVTEALEDPEGIPIDLRGWNYDQIVKQERGKEVIEALASKLRRNPNWNRTTENFHLAVLKQFLKYLNGEQVVPLCISWLRFKRKKNDAGESEEKRPKVIRREDIITEEEMGKLLSTTNHPMYKCAISILWEGLRAGELLSLKRKHITLENRSVQIAVEGKTGRRMVISVLGRGYIRQWMALHPHQDSESFLFLIISNKNKGKRLSYHSLTQSVKGFLKDAKIERKSNLHIFRHSRVVDMLLKGYSPAIIQKAMGWTSLDMLQIYGHLVDEDVHREMLRIEGNEEVLKPKISSIKPRTCEFCSFVNPYNADLCQQCGNALTERGALEKTDKELLKKELETSILEKLVHMGINTKRISTNWKVEPNE